MAAVDKSIYEKITLTSVNGAKSADIRTGVVSLNYYEDVFSPMITARMVVINTGNTIEGDDGKVNFNKNKDGYQKGKDDLIKKNLRNTDRTQRQYDAYDDSDSGNPIPDSKQQPPKNQKPKNKTPLKRGFEDVTGENIKSADIPKTKAELLKKRKEYGITYDKKTKQTTITKDGLEKFTRKSLNKKQIESGNNEPIKLTKADLDKARERVIGGRQIKDSKGNIIGTTTGKYGGRVSGNARKPRVPKTNFQKFKNKASKFYKKVTSTPAAKFTKKRIIKPLGKTLIGRTPQGKLYRGLAALALAPSVIGSVQNKLAGEKAITNKNSKTTGPIVDKTGKPVKFGFSASGTPQGTQGSLYDPKTRKKV